MAVKDRGDRQDKGRKESYRDIRQVRRTRKSSWLVCGPSKGAAAYMIIGRFGVGACEVQD